MQRCQRHKQRNILDHLGESEQDTVRTRPRVAWALTGHEEALASPRALAAELERSRPDAAKSLRKGLEETVTLQRLGASEQLRKTLGSTNPIESMIEVVRRIQRNMKSWQGGDMRKRWTPPGCSRPSASSGGSSATATWPISPSRRAGGRGSYPTRLNPRGVAETVTV